MKTSNTESCRTLYVYINVSTACVSRNSHVTIRQYLMVTGIWDLVNSGSVCHSVTLYDECNPYRHIHTSFMDERTHVGCGKGGKDSNSDHDGGDQEPHQIDQPQRRPLSPHEIRLEEKEGGIEDAKTERTDLTQEIAHKRGSATQSQS